MTTSGASMPLALTLLIAVATIDIPAAVPPTPTGSVVDFVHGRPIADPYRWLEQRSEEHTSELQSLMRISYAVFCLKKKKKREPLTSRETEASILMKMN